MVYGAHLGFTLLALRPFLFAFAKRIEGERVDCHVVLEAECGCFDFGFQLFLCFIIYFFVLFYIIC